MRFQQITFKLGNFTNFKALFPEESMDFPKLSMSKVEKKNLRKGLFVNNKSDHSTRGK